MNTAPTRLSLYAKIANLDKMSKELKKADINRAMEILAYAEVNIALLNEHFETVFAGKDSKFLFELWKSAERRINRNVK